MSSEVKWPIVSDTYSWFLICDISFLTSCVHTMLLDSISGLTELALWFWLWIQNWTLDFATFCWEFVTCPPAVFVPNGDSWLHVRILTFGTWTPHLELLLRHMISVITGLVLLTVFCGWQKQCTARRRPSEKSIYFIYICNISDAVTHVSLCCKKVDDFWL